MLFLGVSGLADIPVSPARRRHPARARLHRRQPGRALDRGHAARPNIVIPFFAFALGTGIDLRNVVTGGPAGIVVGIVAALITGLLVLLRLPLHPAPRLPVRHRLRLGHDGRQRHRHPGDRRARRPALRAVRGGRDRAGRLGRPRHRDLRPAARHLGAQAPGRPAHRGRGRAASTTSDARRRRSPSCEGARPRRRPHGSLRLRRPVRPRRVVARCSRSPAAGATSRSRRPSAAHPGHAPRTPHAERVTARGRRGPDHRDALPQDRLHHPRPRHRPGRGALAGCRRAPARRRRRRVPGLPRDGPHRRGRRPARRRRAGDEGRPDATRSPRSRSALDPAAAGQRAPRADAHGDLAAALRAAAGPTTSSWSTPRDDATSSGSPPPSPTWAATRSPSAPPGSPAPSPGPGGADPGSGVTARRAAARSWWCRRCTRSPGAQIDTLHQLSTPLTRGRPAQCRRRSPGAAGPTTVDLLITPDERGARRRRPTRPHPRRGGGSDPRPQRARRCSSSSAGTAPPPSSPPGRHAAPFVDAPARASRSAPSSAAAATGSPSSPRPAASATPPPSSASSPQSVALGATP